jgi:DNA-directed RNA polymerase beta' subunit
MMMDSGRKLPNHRIKEVEFGVYSNDEVKALSLVQVTNPQCIDMLGYPVVNGPHDTKMGTSG